jgi:hypothetical protein
VVHEGERYFPATYRNLEMSGEFGQNFIVLPLKAASLGLPPLIVALLGGLLARAATTP